MQIDQLSSFASVALAGSLATERLVVICKTIYPPLSTAKQALPGQSEIAVDQRRRLLVLSLTLLASGVTALLIGSGNPWYTRTISAGGANLHWTLFALAISGGSAFWTSVVAYASAAKDARQGEKAQAFADSQRPSATQGAPVRGGVVPTI